MTVAQARAYFALACGDATAFLEGLPEGSVDLIVTDPAYSSLEKHRAHGTTTRLKVSDGSSNVWFPVVPNSYFPEFFAAAYRCLAKDAHLYVYSDQETAHVIKPMGEAAGFTWWKSLIWVKSKVGSEDPSMGMGYHYRAAHELITFFEKGKRRLNNLGVADVLPCPRVRNGYPTEKPVPVTKTLIEQSSSPEQLVVDPFMGSGSTGEAALVLGRHFQGNDIGQDAVDKARERLLRFGTEMPT